MSKHTVAVFQPIVSIDPDGNIDTDWFQSYTGVYDEGGNDIGNEGAEEAGKRLDERLDEIRDLLAVDHGTLAELVRPFFERTD